MKFKVKKGTALYDSLCAVKLKCENATNAANELAKELGGTQAATRNRNRAGGVDAIEFIGIQPDKELWMQVDKKNNPTLFYPRSKKVNVDLFEKMVDLPKVTYDEYNSIINFIPTFGSSDIGEGIVNFRSYGLIITSNYALIVIGNGSGYKPITDMIEITESEYNKLKPKDNA